MADLLLDAFTDAERARFAKYVRKSDDCWIWTAGRYPGGYGSFYLRGRAHAASRVALAMSGVVVRPGDFVLHSCDNPPCVNPAHLRVGTPFENMTDKMSRGRHVVHHGEQNHAASITNAMALEIRRRFAGGQSRREIAESIGIRRSIVSDVIARRTFASVVDRRSSHAETMEPASAGREMRR